MKKIIVYYNFIVVTLFVIAGFLSAANYTQLAVAAAFYPLFIYFALLVIPKRNHAVHIPQIKVIPEADKPKEIIAKEIPTPVRNFDLDRRAFVKLIGSAGISVFFFALLSKKAEGAFFGSVPGPGIIGVKDSSGTRIDPAEKQPTDGYRITELDDGATYIYGGYVHKDGAWFISREEISTGSYRYTKGSSNFSTNWTNRASLTYDYFDTIF